MFIQNLFRITALLGLFTTILIFSPLFADTEQQPAPQVSVEAPVQSEPPSYGHLFLKMMLTLVALIFLVFATIWILKKLSHARFGQLNQNRLIKILEKRALSPKSMLYLVEIEGKRVLVAESQLEVRRIVASDLFNQKESSHIED